jgi:hypothetical protein
MSRAESEITFGYGPENGPLVAIAAVRLEITYANGGRDVIDLDSQDLGPAANIWGKLTSSRQIHDIGDDAHTYVSSATRLDVAISAAYARMRWQHHRQQDGKP